MFLSYSGTRLSEMKTGELHKELQMALWSKVSKPKPNPNPNPNPKSLTQGLYENTARENLGLFRKSSFEGPIDWKDFDTT